MYSMDEGRVEWVEGSQQTMDRGRKEGDDNKMGPKTVRMKMERDRHSHWLWTPSGFPPSVSMFPLIDPPYCFPPLPILFYHFISLLPPYAFFIKFYNCQV